MNKKIFLKKLIIRNFKGIRNLAIDFEQQETTISGENGTGKTTIFDAFTWLLFGKDSTGRSDSGVSSFNIKTLDENGKAILKEEHEVTGVLLSNDKEVTLKRVYLEKWDKPKGTAEETLKNHYSEYYLNGVKLSTKKEYDAEVSSLIPENVFKMITDPFYFNSRPAVEQKEMLMEMAGSITDEYIQSLKPEFEELLKELSGKSLEFFRKEIAAKKKAINDELKEIPVRIDTAKDLMDIPEDWNSLEKELKTKRTKLNEVESQINDKSKLVEAEYKRKSSIQKAIGEKRMERSALENKIRTEANKANNEAKISINNLVYRIEAVRRDINNKNTRISSITSQISIYENELEVLRGTYRNIRDQNLVYPEGAFECPTCERALEVEDIETKQLELEANFNQAKSKKLEKNQKEGKEKSNLKNELQKEKESLSAQIDTHNNEIKSLEAQKQYQESNLPSAQDPDSLIGTNQEWINLGNEINELNNQLTISTSVDTSELNNTKHELTAAIEGLNKRLNKRDNIERAQKKINDLEESKILNNQAKTELERMEFIASDFQKTKDDELMKRINGMFSLVSFSFIEEQLNGGEKITCVCTVDGTPYPDVNNAGKINAGLDIINAICNNKGVTAPIFIDNRESVNKLLPSVSQIVNLVVSNHPKLMIKMSGDEPMEFYQEL